MVVPTAFRWPDAREAGTHARVRARVKRVIGLDLFPDESVAIEYGRLLNTGDPVAERFVNETFLGALGPERAREMLNRALAGSVDDVPDAPESMRELFADFESVPDWVNQELVEQGCGRLATLGLHPGFDWQRRDPGRLHRGLFGGAAVAVRGVCRRLCAESLSGDQSLVDRGVPPRCRADAGFPRAAHLDASPSHACQRPSPGG